MLAQLLSPLSSDPPLVAATVLLIILVLLSIIVLVQGIRDGRRSTITTAAALRRDQRTAKRQAWLRLADRRIVRRRP